MFFVNSYVCNSWRLSLQLMKCKQCTKVIMRRKTTEERMSSLPASAWGMASPIISSSLRDRTAPGQIKWGWCVPRGKHAVIQVCCGSTTNHDLAHWGRQLKSSFQHQPQPSKHRRQQLFHLGFRAEKREMWWNKWLIGHCLKMKCKIVCPRLRELASHAYLNSSG